MDQTGSMSFKVNVTCEQPKNKCYVNFSSVLGH